MFKLSNNSLKHLEGVDPKIISICELAITMTNVDFGIPSTGGLRTTADQAKLFADGKSRADGVKHKSYHQSGMAFDVYAYVNGNASWEQEHLAMVAVAMLQAASALQIQLESGTLWTPKAGSFYGWDMAHYQLVE